MGFNATIEDFNKLGLKEQADGTWKRPTSNVEAISSFEANRRSKILDCIADPQNVFVRLPDNSSLIIKAKHIFPIRPKPGLRMSSSDRWLKGDKQRPAVKQYFEYCTELKRQAEAQGYKLGDRLSVIFAMKVSESWSKKKKEEYLNVPHRQKPDVDNLTKGFMDALKGEDCTVWDIHAYKIWSDRDAIIVF